MFRLIKSESACVQALFERAVSAKGTQQCALLWRAYIGYECARGRGEAARRVFLRAIHACPWSKVKSPSNNRNLHRTNPPLASDPDQIRNITSKP